MRRNSFLVHPLAFIMSSNLALFASQVIKVTYFFKEITVNLTTTGVILSLVLYEDCFFFIFPNRGTEK